VAHVAAELGHAMAIRRDRHLDGRHIEKSRNGHMTGLMMNGDFDLGRHLDSFNGIGTGANDPIPDGSPGAGCTHHMDQIFRVLSVPADGTSAAKLKEAETSVRLRFVGSSPTNFVSLSMRMHVGTRHAQHNRGSRIYWLVRPGVERKARRSAPDGGRSR
jgi:hypothetical protein